MIPWIIDLSKAILTIKEGESSNRNNDKINDVQPGSAKTIPCCRLSFASLNSPSKIDRYLDRVSIPESNRKYKDNGLPIA